MKRHTAREMTVEECDEWVVATGRLEEVGEGGGRGGRAEPLVVRPIERTRSGRPIC